MSMILPVSLKMRQIPLYFQFWFLYFLYKGIIPNLNSDLDSSQEQYDPFPYSKCDIWVEKTVFQVISFIKGDLLIPLSFAQAQTSFCQGEDWSIY